MLGISDSDRARVRRLSTGIVGLTISAVAVTALLAIIDIGATAGALARTNLWLVAATLLLVPGQIGLRTLRWTLLLPARRDGTRPGPTRVLPVLLAGYLANLVLPARLGEPARAFVLARREQLSFARVLGSVLLERVMDLATLAAVAIVAALRADAPDWMVRGMIVVAGLGLGLTLAMVASGIPRALAILGRLLGARTGRLRTALDQATRFGEGTTGGGFGRLVVAVALSTVTWGFVAGTYWLAARSLGIELGVSAAMLVAAVTTLGTAIPSAPANIGTFEVAAVVVLTALQVPPAEGLALALLVHAIVTVPFAVTGAAAAGWLSISLTQVADEAAASLPAEPVAGT